MDLETADMRARQQRQDEAARRYASQMGGHRAEYPVRRISYFILGFGAVALLIWWGLEKRWEREDRRIRETERQEAIHAEWVQSVKDGWHRAEKQFRAVGCCTLREDPWTIDVEQALSPDEHRPIVFIGHIADVASERDGLRVVWQAQDTENVRFYLHCPETLRQEFLKGRAENHQAMWDPTRYLVVSTIAKIRKVDLRIEADQEYAAVDEHSLPPIDLNLTSDGSFIAYGDCIDVTKIQAEPR